MKRKAGSFILLLIVTVYCAFSQSIPDLEGWGKTKWGMSINEVAEIIGSPWKSAVNLNEGRSGLKPLYRIVLNDGFNEFYIDFLFGSGKLELVSVYSSSFSEISTLYALSIKYGAITGQYTLEIDYESIKYWWWRFPLTGVLLVSDYKTYEMKKRIQYPLKNSEIIHKNLNMPSPIYIEFSPNTRKIWLP